MKPPDGADLVPLVKARSPLEAHTIAAILEEAQIPARAFDALLAGMQVSLDGGPPRCAVLVQRERWDEAKRVIEESDRAASELDWEQVDVGTADEGTLRTLELRGRPSWRRASQSVAVVLLILALVVALLRVARALVADFTG